MIRSQSGFSLVEIVLVAGVLALVVTVSGQLVSNISVGQQRAAFIEEMSHLRDSYKALLEKDNNWQEILNRNTGAAAPVANQLRNFVIYDFRGNLPLNYNPLSSPGGQMPGLTPQGRACVGFNPDPRFATMRCPARYTFQWQQVPNSCTGTGCTPDIQVILNFQVSAPPGSALHGVRAERFSLSLRKSGVSGETTYTQCRPGDVAIGFNADGNPLCRNKNVVLAQ